VRSIFGGAALAAWLAVAGCAGQRGGESLKPKESAAAENAPTYQDEGKGKEVAGWRWGGKRGDCFFVAANRCFAEEEAACKAASCGKKGCVVEGGGPATVKCGE
jgi:hypothetical protein